jgi:hypothetical protein
LVEGLGNQCLASGSVRVGLLWFGGAHTEGEELTFVEPDGTLVPATWCRTKTSRTSPALEALRRVDKIATLDVRHVLPDHSAPGDGSLVSAERAFITDLRSSALALKAKGVEEGNWLRKTGLG